MFPARSIRNGRPFGGGRSCRGGGLDLGDAGCRCPVDVDDAVESSDDNPTGLIHSSWTWYGLTR